MSQQGRSSKKIVKILRKNNLYLIFLFIEKLIIFVTSQKPKINIFLREIQQISLPKGSVSQTGPVPLAGPYHIGNGTKYLQN